MISLPKVSIVIPVFNGADYLSEAIESSLSQTYQNTEIIIVNDGSNDNGATERIALSYGNRVRYFQKENGGVATALNLAIEKMSGEYFSWLSHDDLYFENKVEVQIEMLTKIAETKAILYSDFGVFWDDPAKLKEVRLPDTPPNQFRYFITVMNSLHGCSLLIPKEAFKECGLFSPMLRTTQDFDLWFRMAEKYKFIHVPEVLVKGRAHAEQGSLKMKDTVLLECNNLLTDFVERLSEAELTRGSRKSVTHAYALIAQSFERRGFQLAANNASRLAIQNLGNTSFLDAIKSFCLLIKIKMVDTRLRSLRSVFTKLKLRVRKCLK